MVASEEGLDKAIKEKQEFVYGKQREMSSMLEAQRAETNELRDEVEAARVSVMQWRAVARSGVH